MRSRPVLRLKDRRWWNHSTVRPILVRSSRIGGLTMPRAIWSGSISFGLVNIPVKLFSAISEKSVRFNQLDRRNNARVRQQRVNAETGEEVSYEDIVKGFEVTKGHYVVLTDDDLAAFAPEATHTIDLVCFVDLDEIDPIYFDGAYH